MAFKAFKICIKDLTFARFRILNHDSKTPKSVFGVFSRFREVFYGLRILFRVFAPPPPPQKMDVDNCALNLIKLEYHDSLSLGKQAHPMTNELIPATMHPTKPKLTSTVAKGTSEKDYIM